jgi:hypothetical protein
VKRADEIVSLDTPAMPEVGAQVWAVRVEQRRRPVLGSKQHEFLPEVQVTLDVAGRELGTGRDSEPAARVRRKIDSFGHAPSLQVSLQAFLQVVLERAL